MKSLGSILEALDAVLGRFFWALFGGPDLEAILAIPGGPGGETQWAENGSTPLGSVRPLLPSSLARLSSRVSISHGFHGPENLGTAGKAWLTREQEG